ncbi:predicted protein [Chaetoceros tenuissimus]|uniref:Uncharacterized protein n=1 Tax=Chaetoceros tenuissimus TaxID=426638 RepID=A0AAD3CTP0_9STRA|nr:predicted protein [Chaetoceros tenuissimus]
MSEEQKSNNARVIDSAQNNSAVPQPSASSTTALSIPQLIALPWTIFINLLQTIQNMIENLNYLSNEDTDILQNMTEDNDRMNDTIDEASSEQKNIRNDLMDLKARLDRLERMQGGEKQD